MNGRLQTMPEEFYEIVNNPNPHEVILFDSTEKIDGQSATYFIEKHKILGIFDQYEFGVCSRNLRKWKTFRFCKIKGIACLEKKKICKFYYKFS